MKVGSIIMRLFVQHLSHFNKFTHLVHPRRRSSAGTFTYDFHLRLSSAITVTQDDVHPRYSTATTFICDDVHLRRRSSAGIFTCDDFHLRWSSSATLLRDDVHLHGLPAMRFNIDDVHLRWSSTAITSPCTCVVRQRWHSPAAMFTCADVRLRQRLSGDVTAWWCHRVVMSRCSVIRLELD